MMLNAYPLLAALLAAAAQPAPQQRAAAFEALVQCRTIAQAEARLSCFDAAAAALERAEAQRDVVIVDRGQVRESRRRLFGLALPELPIFGRRSDADEQAEEIRSVEGTVRSAIQNGNGQWIVTLEDGGVWVQTDDAPLALRPRPGQPVRINRAAMGSYMMRINNQPGLRARRQM